MSRNPVRAGIALSILAVAGACGAQRTARISPPCADAVRQATELMGKATYTPEGIGGYDPAFEQIQLASQACKSRGDERLYSAGRHMLSLARTIQTTRSRAARELMAAPGADAAQSWARAGDDPRSQTVVVREARCQSAILAAVKDRRVTVRIHACDLTTYE